MRSTRIGRHAAMIAMAAAMGIMGVGCTSSERADRHDYPPPAYANARELYPPSSEALQASADDRRYDSGDYDRGDYVTADRNGPDAQTDGVAYIPENNTGVQTYSDGYGYDNDPPIYRGVYGGGGAFYGGGYSDFYRRREFERRQDYFYRRDDRIRDRNDGRRERDDRHENTDRTPREAGPRPSAERENLTPRPVRDARQTVDRNHDVTPRENTHRENTSRDNPPRNAPARADRPSRREPDPPANRRGGTDPVPAQRNAPRNDAPRNNGPSRGGDSPRR